MSMYDTNTDVLFGVSSLFVTMIFIYKIVLLKGNLKGSNIYLLYSIKEYSYKCHKWYTTTQMLETPHTYTYVIMYVILYIILYYSYNNG